MPMAESKTTFSESKNQKLNLKIIEIMNKKTIMRAVLTAVLSLVATTATAHDFEVDGIYYNNNGDGTVSVTFKGSSYNEYAD